jgi:hypothetical protein
MHSAIIVHEVKDFDTWKTAFDAHEGARRAAGIVMHNLHRDADAPNRVVVFMAAEDAETLPKFASSDELKEKMMEAGVVGAPDITFMQNRGMNLAEGAGQGVVVRHPVADYDKWRAAFDGHDGARTEAGMKGWSVNTAADDGNAVIAFVQSDDMAKVRSFTADPSLEKVMTEAGVNGPPSFTFVEHVEMKRYA